MKKQHDKGCIQVIAIFAGFLLLFYLLVELNKMF